MGRKKKKKEEKSDVTKWTITQWETWLWKTFSRYIRLRDCLKTTGTVHKGKCVTCGKEYSFNRLQAGHFIPGRTRAILFNESCVHAQCYRCNIVLGGNWPPYYRFMQKHYGQTIIELLIDLYGKDKKLKPEWFLEHNEYYAQAIKAMLIENRPIDYTVYKYEGVKNGNL